MPRNRQAQFSFWLVQAIALAGIGFSALRGGTGRADLRILPGKAPDVVHIERELPLRVESLYDDPELVSDEELLKVLKQVLPKFSQQNLKPNFVEHALRIWGVDAEFRDPLVLSGPQLRDVLTDNGRYLASWGDKVQPLLVESRDGVEVRWGKEEGASVHHDHWIACLAEAGAPLDEPIFTPAKHTRTINDAVQQALRDFRVDEREYEWSAMAFGLWLPPVKTWRAADGRQVSFEMLVHRLLRGDKRFGVCSGTHRLYSLVLLARLDDQFSILSPEVHEEIMAHMRGVRQLLIDSQFADGHWPSNWELGAEALAKPIDDPLRKQVISTGHHLEWMAIAPEELHPPRELIRKAARWAIDTTVSRTPAQILEHYTFYSHIGGALSLWRKTRPADFWRAHEDQAAALTSNPDAPADLRPPLADEHINEK
ncbi:MAG: hypothetical protein HY290_03580 [Planctomycetia bacterium]|nr:hypothetical protein [Planctomycetia bacterium]